MQIRTVLWQSGKQQLLRQGIGSIVHHSLSSQQQQSKVLMLPQRQGDRAVCRAFGVESPHRAWRNGNKSALQCAGYFKHSRTAGCCCRNQ